MTGKKVSSFRERFTELVKESSKTQATIASEFGVAKQTISAWITGQTSPRVPVITSLADYFQVSIGWLMGFDVEKRSDKKVISDYESYLDHLFENENKLITTYRSLSPRGQELLLDRADELSVLYRGESSDSVLPEKA